jgi:hypothetical protein
MHIWTTPYLNSQLAIADLPVRLFSDEDVRDAFLKQAERGDIAIVPYGHGCRTFLDEVKERGIGSPVVLLAQNGGKSEKDPPCENVIIFDLKQEAAAAVGRSIRFILFTALHYQCAKGASVAPEAEFPDTAEAAPIETSDSVAERLTHAMKKEISVIAALQIREQGEPVTARGVCAIREFTHDELVLHRFRHAPLVHGMNEGMPITLYVPYKQASYSAVVHVLRRNGTTVRVTMPRQLFISREMRLQPNRDKPIALYMHIPHEPTRNLRVLDISPSGIGFTCGRDLPVGQVYGCTIMLPDPPAVVLTPAILRFKKEDARGFRYGAELQPHPWDRDSLSKYIFAREAELISLLRGSES